MHISFVLVVLIFAALTAGCASPEPTRTGKSAVDQTVSSPGSSAQTPPLTRHHRDLTLLNLSWCNWSRGMEMGDRLTACVAETKSGRLHTKEVILELELSGPEMTEAVRLMDALAQASDELTEFIADGSVGSEELAYVCAGIVQWNREVALARAWLDGRNPYVWQALFLVLQSQMKQAAFVVALPGPGLVPPSPPRPGQDEIRHLFFRPYQAGEQSAHLRDRQGYQLFIRTVAAPFSPCSIA